MRPRVTAALFATTIALVVAVALGVGPAGKSTASVGTVQFSTTPALYPAFSAGVTDYVVRCTGTAAVQVAVTNSDASDTTTAVSVDGQAARGRARSMRTTPQARSASLV